MGATIAQVLEPGGFFFIGDEHPFAKMTGADLATTLPGANAVR